MTRNIKISLSFLIVSTFIFSAFNSSYSFKTLKEKNLNLTSDKLVSMMMDSVHSIKTLEFKIIAFERIDGSYLSAESVVKLTYKPHSIYFRNEKKKISVLWQEGLNKGNAIVKAKMLMGVPVSLDPLGNMMRKNQHYTIMELGFEYFSKVFYAALTRDKGGISKDLNYIGKKKLGERNCHVLVYENKNFGYREYKCGKTETVRSISNQLFISDYAIREKNHLIGVYGVLKEGTLLKVPTDYAKKVIVYLDEKTLLPVSLTSYDDVGLFENYEYVKIEKNKKFTDEFKQFYAD